MRKKNNTLDLSFSLLWPNGWKVKGVPLSGETVRDLDVEKIVEFMAPDPKSRDFMGNILKKLCFDQETIEARLDVIEDMLCHRELAVCLEEIMPDISSIAYFLIYSSRREELTPLQEVVWRLRELEYYSRCVEKLGEVLSGREFRSRGWHNLGRMIREVRENTVFKNLKKALPGLLQRIGSLNSITIGINLNGGLIPCEATLLAINSEEFSGSSFTQKLIGKNPWQGIAPLHTPSDKMGYADPMLTPVFRDISKIMHKAVAPLARALKEFVSINSRLLLKLKEEFRFFLGAVKCIDRIRDCGLPMVRPTILEKEQRRLNLENLFNLNLAIHHIEHPGLKEMIVGNDFTMDEKGRIVILTGPNRGGKTTITQAVGLAQIMAQVGLYVPAGGAVISLVDNIFTHYPMLESLEKGTGRFGEEVERLHLLFNAVTRHSLVLMNESLTSTSAGEGLYLAQDLTRVFRMIGTRIIFTTHLHQLAAMVDEINGDTDGDSRLISLVAMIKEESGNIYPTFLIIPGQPRGKSYARELAVRFGITRKQLVSRLVERGEITEFDR